MSLRKGGFNTVEDVVEDVHGAASLIPSKKDRDVLQGYLSVRAGKSKEEVELSERRAAAFKLVRDSLDDLNKLQTQRSQLGASSTKKTSSTGAAPTKEASDLLDRLDDAKERLQAAQQELATLAELGNARRRPSTASSATSSAARKATTSNAGSTSPRVANEAAAQSQTPAAASRCYSRSTPRATPPLRKGPIPEWGDEPYMDSFRSSKPSTTRRPASAAASRSAPPQSTSTSWGAPAPVPRRMDPNNWNRNPPISRIDHLTRMYKPRMAINPRVPRPDLGGLEVVGAKANPISLGMEVRNETTQMYGGATAAVVL